MGLEMGTVMPKEVIAGDCFDVEVRWGASQMLVQIGSVMKPAQTAESPASLGTLIETWEPEERFSSQGLFSNLQRHQINNLIKMLRRARDSAFGRDE